MQPQSPLLAGPCILLDMLPPEMLQIIIVEHLEDRADVQAVSRTCHALHSLTSSPVLEAAWLWRWHGDQALFQTSARSLSLAVLRQLVEVHHVNINAQRAADNLAFSLLHLACQADRTKVVEFLISAPRIIVNQACGDDGMEMTPLHMACMAGSIRAVRQLLALPQIQINAVTPDGLSSLHMACIKKKIEIVAELLRHPDINVNLLTVESSRSPLSAAAGFGNLAVVALLLQHPAINVNAADDLWLSPLSVAIYKGHVPVVHELLKHPDIQVNANNGGLTILDFACAKGNLAIIRELLEHPRMDADSVNTALAIAVARKQTAVVALLRGSRAWRCVIM